MAPYRETQPSAPLAEWVECFWQRDGHASRDDVEQRILPDGAADIVIDLNRGDAFVVGTMTTPLVLRSRDAPDLLGVRFRPGRASPFVRAELAPLTDERVALADLWGCDAKSFADEVASTRSLAFVEERLVRIARDAETDRRVDAAIEEIARSGGSVAIDALALRIGISRQHLARRFLAEVGVTPKTFARVMRFRRVLARASRSREREWAALASESGYFDQSHLIADFRRFAGMNPVPFFQSEAAARL